MSLFTPARVRGFEHLDDPSIDDGTRDRSMRDVGISNRVFGGASAMLSEMARVVEQLAGPLTVLDVGTGTGDIPRAATRLLTRPITTIGVDGSVSLAHGASRVLDESVCADAKALPFGDRSVDVVTCSQVLHHFTEDDIGTVLLEANRVARSAVIVGDLRRSWIAAGGFWMASWPLGFHPITRHDGTTSVLRGFTSHELAQHVRAATGCEPVIRRHLGFRLTATWSPQS